MGANLDTMAIVAPPQPTAARAAGMNDCTFSELALAVPQLPNTCRDEGDGKLAEADSRFVVA